jgi:hypothetical protein
MRVADADDPTLVQDHEAERAADAGQHLEQGLHRVLGGFVGEERGQELGVGRGRQTRPTALQLAQ